jgi:hypothetical protein
MNRWRNYCNPQALSVIVNKLFGNLEVKRGLNTVLKMMELVMAAKQQNNWFVDYRCHLTDTGIKCRFSGHKHLLLLIAGLLALAITSATLVVLIRPEVVEGIIAAIK